LNSNYLLNVTTRILIYIHITLPVYNSRLIHIQLVIQTSLLSTEWIIYKTRDRSRRVPSRWKCGWKKSKISSYEFA